MNFKILTDKLLKDYAKAVIESSLNKIENSTNFEMPIDYFQYNKSVPTLHSSISRCQLIYCKIN